MTHLNNTIELSARILLAAIFILAGFSKITGYEATAAYMASQGVPGQLLPLVILLEVGGGIAIVLGLLTRLVALALAGFSVMSALLFHFDLGDQTQFILFFKNLAMAGGFLLLVTHGAGAWSLDARRNSQ
ncbi:MAG: DoxX family protein [Salinisphaeraceae bacterium]|nr:DoxX family protein [Salinisphaeraceae bacterium]